MTISILGCGWYGLALAKALLADGVAVKGSTTSPQKLALLADAGIVPFLLDLSENLPLNTDFFNCDVLVISIPPKARSGAGAEYVPKLQRVIDAIHLSTVKKGYPHQLYRCICRPEPGSERANNTPQPNTPAGQVLFEAEELFRRQNGV
jgi:predicted dinucleotide-binding enzyme